jgi:hypothetical protein
VSKGGSRGDGYGYYSYDYHEPDEETKEGQKRNLLGGFAHR